MKEITEIKQVNNLVRNEWRKYNGIPGFGAAIGYYKLNLLQRD